MKSSIILINQTVGPLFLDVAKAFSNYGFEVIIWTGSITIKDSKIYEEFIINYGPQYKKRNFFIRAFSWVTFSIWVKIKLTFLDSRQKLLVVSNPPIIPILIPKRFINSSLLIYDLYPNILSGLGFLSKRNLLYRLWCKTNVKKFKNFKFIYTIGYTIASKLEAYIDKSKITVVPNWSTISSSNEVKINNEFNLCEDENKLLILYSGNFGLTHPIEFIADIIKYSEDLPIKWIFVGEGGKKEFLIDFKYKNNLNNLMILPFQPMEKFSLILNSVHIGLVLLSPSFSGMSVPSKIYNILACGKTVLAICESNNEVSNLIEEYKVGKYFSISEKFQLINFLREILENKNKLVYYSQRSKKASSFFTRKNANLYPKKWIEE